MFKCPTVRTLVLGAATVAITCGVIPVNAKPIDNAVDTGRKIVIVHTNDLHGNLDADSKKRGGLTRIASLIKQIRRDNPKSVIYLDAGDVAQGTPISNSFYGEPMFKAIKSMGPSAGTLGNHEFDWGVDKAKSMVSNAGYPILAANVVDKRGRHPFQPYRVVETNGVKIGIIGLVTPDVPIFVKKGNTGDYKFLDPSKTATKYLPKMYAEGADLIVALTHMGVDADKELAANVPAIDVIVGGHSHTKLADPVNVGGHTWIVQADKYGRCLGVVEMMVNPYNGKVYSFNGKLVNLDAKAEITPDKDVTEILSKYNDKIKPVMDQQVAKTDVELHKSCAEGQFDSTLGNAICDALRAKTKADVAVYNWGGIREDSLASGNVNRGAIFKILPFDDQVVTIKIKGADLLELLSQAVKMKDRPLQVSGIEAKFDVAANKAVDVKVNGKDLDPNAVYTLATTEFLAGGGDDYTAMNKGTVEGRFDFARDVFIDYLNDQEVFTSPKTGRIVLSK